MVSEDIILKAFQSGFRNERKTDYELPPGYTWAEQIKKYCQGNLWEVLQTHAYLDFRDEEFTPDCRARRRLPRHTARNKFGYVFCHRGLYDRARGIPENSLLAVETGLNMGLLLHEVDGRLVAPDANGRVESPLIAPGRVNSRLVASEIHGPVDGRVVAPEPQGRWKIFLAHDEVATRTTSKSGRWSSYNIGDIMETLLVTRRFDVDHNTFASSYVNTAEKVPFLDDLDPLWLDKSGETTYFQIDLRGTDFANGLSALFSGIGKGSMRLILKGYNIDFPSYSKLEKAILGSRIGLGGQTFTFTAPLPELAIMVFYPDPIIALALQRKGIDPDTASLEDKLSLSFEEIYETFKNQALSFYNQKEFTFIFEIVHTGLGLGYRGSDHRRTKHAVNPLDGTRLTDEEVAFQSCVDRAMIKVGIELRADEYNVTFSSCTRLCDVRTSKGEMIASMTTGRMIVLPDGEKGLSKKLRGIHGGMYPQSDLVVADDPFAEIAARTWIDEYAKLDRSRLLEMHFNEWLALGGPDVVSAIDKIDGLFLQNTFDGPIDHNWNILVEEKNHGVDQQTDDENQDGPKAQLKSHHSSAK